LRKTFGKIVNQQVNPLQVYLSLFLELNSTSSLAYTFFAILFAWSLAGWALDTNTINHSLSSFWTINFRRGLRMLLNSSRSWEEKIRVTLDNKFCNRNNEKFMNQNLLNETILNWIIDNLDYFLNGLKFSSA